VTDLLIEREVVIEAPIDVVWRTVTEPDQIAQWFADRVELDARPGGLGAFFFEDESGATVHAAPIVIDTMRTPTFFSFRWGHRAGEAPTAANSVLVELTLTAETPERTRLRVVESGLEHVAWPEADKETYAAEHRSGWATYLTRLADLRAEHPGPPAA
jgi:uncharacterized protein YndB with AHSA1/START domain